MMGKSLSPFCTRTSLECETKTEPSETRKQILSWMNIWPKLLNLLPRGPVFVVDIFYCWVSYLQCALILLWKLVQSH